MVDSQGEIQMKGKKVVVTGGAGFIGSNLAEQLAMNNETILVDDFSTGRLGNIQHLIEKEDVTLIKGNVTDMDLLIGAFEGVDYVFHLAAIPSVRESIETPLLTTAVNIEGTLNVLCASRDASVEKVVFASSAAVYGDSGLLPLKEDTILNPISPYGAQKLVGEHYCRVFYEIYGLRSTSLRYFNVFGPRQDSTSEYAAVIPKFISQVLQEKNPIIFGDGLQTRDFIYVEDAVRANIAVAENKASDGEVINLATGKATSINELANQIIDIFEKSGLISHGKEITPKYDDPREGDILHSVAEVSKLKQLISYNPCFSLERALLETINHFIGKSSV